MGNGLSRLYTHVCIYAPIITKQEDMNLTSGDMREALGEGRMGVMQMEYSYFIFF